MRELERNLIWIERWKNNPSESAITGMKESFSSRSRINGRNM
jgi:hypothetical protein